MSFDAAEFLDALFRGGPVGAVLPPPAPGPAPAGPAGLPPEWREAWVERAAIMEYDGGLPRERAEQLALAEVLAAMRRADA